MMMKKKMKKKERLKLKKRRMLVGQVMPTCTPRLLDGDLGIGRRRPSMANRHDVRVGVLVPSLNVRHQ